MCRGHEFTNGNNHHHSRNHAKQDGIEGVRKGIGENQPRQEARQWFGNPRQHGPTKGLPSVPRGIVDWHGDTQSFGDVVNGNGHGEDSSHFGIVQGGNKGGQSFGEIVETNRQGRIERHAHQMLIILFRVLLFRNHGFIFGDIFIVIRIGSGVHIMYGLLLIRMIMAVGYFGVNVTFAEPSALIIIINIILLLLWLFVGTSSSSCFGMLMLLVVLFFNFAGHELDLFQGFDWIFIVTRTGNVF